MLQATSVLLVAGLGLGAPGIASEHGPWLVDATGDSGVDFVHVRAAQIRYWLPEIMSGGACWLDYDRDGDLDLYLVQGGALPGDPATAGARGDEGEHRNALYRNDGPGGRDGPGRKSGDVHFVEVAAPAGVDDAGYGMGCAIGDVDGDGWPDLYVTNLGPNVLFRNRGDGDFERMGTDAGAADPGWGSSAAFLDYDGDGDLDLFLVNYLDWSPAQEIDCFSGGLRDYCHPDRFRAPAPDRLLRNRGDGRFEDVSEQAGITAAFGNGLGVAVLDHDDDGLPDIYVANDGMVNQLWRNLGDGSFRDVALLAGVAVNRVGSPEAGMGVQAVDVDGDLDLDLFVTHLRAETNTLYVNQGGGQFADLTAASGLGAASLGFTGFGLGFVDFDQDGRVDLFVGNGRVGRGIAANDETPFAEPDHLYRGLGGGRFELTESGELEAPDRLVASRGAAFGDFDGDGDVDIAVVASGAGARLLLNRGSVGAWVAVRLLGGEGRPVVGARVVATAAGEARLGVIDPAYGYCSASESRAHFGLGDGDRIESIAVTLPGRSRASRLYRTPPARATLVLPPS